MSKTAIGIYSVSKVNGTRECGIICRDGADGAMERTLYENDNCACSANLGTGDGDVCRVCYNGL